MSSSLESFVDLKITTQEPLSLEASIVVAKDYPSFSGHFPGRPILPAVSVIDISLHILNQARVGYADESRLQVSRSKFTGMIAPEQKILVRAERKRGSHWIVTWFSDLDSSRLAVLNLKDADSSSCSL